MPSPAELEARLRLHALPELGPRRFRRLLQAFASASAALSAPASAWRTLGLPAVCADARRSPEVRERARAALAWLEQPGQQLLMWDAPEYPALLAELPDAPPLLFVAGNAGLLMVFRAYEKLSYGLVLVATRQLAVLDTVRNP